MSLVVYDNCSVSQLASNSQRGNIFKNAICTEQTTSIKDARMRVNWYRWPDQTPDVVSARSQCNHMKPMKIPLSHC